MEVFRSVRWGSIAAQERQRIVDSRPIVPTTEEIARQSGRIDGELRAAGRPVDIGDATIRITALVKAKPMLNRNVNHFERISRVNDVHHQLNVGN